MTPKKKKILFITATAVLVTVAIILPLTLRQKDAEPDSTSQQTAQPPPVSSSAPATSSAPPTSNVPAQSAAPGSGSDTIPYVGPIESFIIGKWERYNPPLASTADAPTSIDPKKPVYVITYEFVNDGTLVNTKYDVLDAEYPENWEFELYNFSFDTYRGEDVFYCSRFSFPHDEPLYYRFYKWEDGRDAFDLWQQERDGSIQEYPQWTFLRLER